MSDWKSIDIALKLISVSGIHPQRVKKLHFAVNLAILVVVTFLVVLHVVVNFHMSQLEAISFIYYSKMSDWETLGTAFKLIRVSGLHPLNVNKPVVIFNFAMLVVITFLVFTNMVVAFRLTQLEAITYIYYVWIKFGNILMLKRKPLKKMLEMIKKFKPNDFLSEENTIYRKYVGWLKGYVAYLVICLFFVIGNSFTMETATIFEAYRPNGVPHVVLYFLELYVLLLSYFSIVGASVLASTLLLAVAQQMNSLNKKIRTYDLTDLLNEDRERQFMKVFKEDISYHVYLLKCVVQLNEILSFPLLMQLVGDVYVLCINMYGFSTKTALVAIIRHAVLTLEVIAAFVFLFGYPSQLVMETAEDIGESVYCHCTWYLPNIISVRKDLLIMLVRSQKTVAISAGGFTDVNNRTLLFLLKTAYSFYTYLQTVS